MASLENKRIKETYQSLLKTEDNGNVGATLKTITDGQGNSIGIQVNTDGDLSASGNISAASLTAAGLNYPITDGSSGQAIVTDGNGNLSFVDAGGSPVAGTNINIGAGDEINLDDNIVLNSVTCADSSNGKSKIEKDSISIGYSDSGSDINQIQLKEKSIRAENGYFASFGTQLSINTGINDPSFNGSPTPNSVISRINLEPHNTVGGTVLHSAPQFYGMTSVVDFGNTPSTDISSNLGGFKPQVGSDNGGLILQNSAIDTTQTNGGFGSNGKFFSEMTDLGGFYEWNGVNTYNFWDFERRFNGTMLEPYLWVNGMPYGFVSYTSSDYRIKQNVSPIEDNAIERVKQLNPVSFNWKTTDKFGYRDETAVKEGFIAHELQDVIPSAVKGEKDGEVPQSLDLDSIVAVLTKAIQEQQVIIEELRSEVEILKSK